MTYIIKSSLNSMRFNSPMVMNLTLSLCYQNISFSFIYLFLTVLLIATNFTEVWADYQSIIRAFKVLTVPRLHLNLSSPPFFCTFSCLYKDILTTVNTSRQSGIFPALLKSSIAKPLLKKNSLNLSVINNCRHITNLTLLCSILRKKTHPRVTTDTTLHIEDF